MHMSIPVIVLLRVTTATAAFLNRTAYFDDITTGNIPGNYLDLHYDHGLVSDPTAFNLTTVGGLMAHSGAHILVGGQLNPGLNGYSEIKVNRGDSCTTQFRVRGFYFGCIAAPNELTTNKAGAAAGCFARVATHDATGKEIAHEDIFFEVPAAGGVSVAAPMKQWVAGPAFAKAGADMTVDTTGNMKNAVEVAIDDFAYSRNCP